MTFGRLLWRNLLFHWRGNLAVLLGVVVGTAVLTGALLVGDSLRGSLRQLTVQQLGRIDYVLVAGRLIRQELAGDLAEDGAAARVAPALVLQGAVNGAVTSTGEPAAGGAALVGTRAGRVTIMGVDAEFWRLWPGGRPPVDAAFWASDRAEVVLNAALARELGVDPGGTVRLHLQKVSAIPRESVLGRQDPGDVIDDVRMTVKAVLTDDAPGGRFNLNPSPSTPRDAFVPLAALQKELTRRRAGQPDLGIKRPINALLAEAGTDALQGSLAKHLRFPDWGLELRGPARRAEAFFTSLDRNHDGKVTAREWPRLRDRDFARQVGARDGVLDRAALVAYYRKHHNCLSLESRRLFIGGAVAEAAHRAAKKTGFRDAPTLVYLADQVAGGSGQVMNYAVIAALDPALPPPLGPFLPEGMKRLADNTIVLVDWPGSPLPESSGLKEVRVRYYDPEERQTKPLTRGLTVAGWIGLRGAADDPDLTPEFPGITDRPSLEDWDPPASLHYEKKRVTAADENYWKSYRTTPKAYVNLATGQKLWASRFGKLTSIRLARTGPGAAGTPGLLKAGERFKDELLGQLTPAQGGLVFDAIGQRAERASAGSNDFSLLFLGFSIFIIVAALLLVGLLFRLNLDRRAAEIGLLLATGIRRGTVRRLLLTEGGILAVVGAVIGSAGAVGYAWLLLEYLRASWPGGLERSFLHLDATAASFVIGFAAAVLVSVLTIAWSTRVLGRVAPRALLAGETADAETTAGVKRAGRRRVWVGGLALVGAVACVAFGFIATDHESQAGGFFGSGFLLLVAGLVAVWSYLRREQRTPSRHLATLGVRNASRHPVRSLLTVGLLAAATFLVLAVDSFHRAPGQDFREPHGSSGGFNLVAESEVPLYLPLESARGRDDLDEAVKRAVQDNYLPKAARDALKGVTFVSFRFKGGDDASCLNLARPLQPQLLGVPAAFVTLDRFRFQASEAESPADKDNPWRLLDRPAADKNGTRVVPVIADATTAKYTLKAGLGESVPVQDENGRPVRLRVVGLLDDSIFQSELLLSDANFRALYPGLGGYRFFLIDAPAGRGREVKNVLERALADHGLTVTSTRERMQAYLDVENTYIATFQALGGLGLLLGALGLAVVLLRSVWERRGELALLRALGFRRSALGWLVLAENAFLLVVGLAVGAVTALVAVAPPVLTGTGAVPWLRVAVLIALVLAVGLTAGAAAVAATLRAPLIPALRRE